VDPIIYINHYIRNPEDKDVYPQVQLLCRLIRQISKHEDKGEFGNRICRKELVGLFFADSRPRGNHPADLIRISQFFTYISPKLRDCLKVLFDCVQRREKACLWVIYPFEQILLEALYHYHGLSARSFIANTANVNEKS